MKSKNNKIDKLKSKIIKVLKEHKVVRAGIFGSYARGEETKDSDIDILVKTYKPLGFAFMQIQFDLEDELMKKIDLLSYNAIHPLLKERILNEEIRII